MSDYSGLTGVLDLEIEERHGKSIVKKVFHDGGIKVQRPVYLDEGTTPCYYLLSPHGAIFDSDLYYMKIKLHENARLTLTTLGATKIYKVANKTAEQNNDIFLGKGSYFEFLPDATIAYENARYFQKNNIYMESGSTLVLMDIITPGWSPDDEPFKYTKLQLKSFIYQDEALVVYDHVKLTPKEQRIEALGFLDGYSHFGTLLVVSDFVDDDLINRLHGFLSSQPYDMKFGISKLSVSGFTIRFLARMTQHIHDVALECRNFINKEWFGLDLGGLRKY